MAADDGQRRQRAVASVAVLQAELPLSVYVYAAPRCAAKATLVAVRARQPAAAAGIALELVFEFDGHTYTSPSVLGWAMIRAARTWVYPREPLPFSINFNGWRRLKIEHASRFMMLTRFISPRVRAGAAVWQPPVAPTVSYHFLRTIVDNNGDGRHHMYDGAPVAALATAGL